jgi:hypothetical protein
MLSTFPPNCRSSPMSSLMVGRYFLLRPYMYYFDQYYYDCSLGTRCYDGRRVEREELMLVWSSNDMATIGMDMEGIG